MNEELESQIDDAADFLLANASLEGTEVGEHWSAIARLWQSDRSNFESPGFEAALADEIQRQEAILQRDYQIVDTLEEVRVRSRKALVPRDGKENPPKQEAF